MDRCSVRSVQEQFRMYMFPVHFSGERGVHNSHEILRGPTAPKLLRAEDQIPDQLPPNGTVSVSCCEPISQQSTRIWQVWRS